MLLRHPISRRGFLLGTSLAASHVLPSDAKNDPNSLPETGEFQPAPVTMQTSVEDFGVAWNFNEPQPVVYSCLGEPCVLLQPGAQVVSTDPPSKPRTGGWDHGVMVNPWGNRSAVGGKQGWDPRYGSDPAPTMRNEYDANLNVDPGKSGEPLTLGEATYVKAIRRSNPGTQQGHVDRYSYLTVLNQHPPAGFFRASPAKLTKEAPWSETDVNYNVVRNLIPVSGQPNFSTAESYTHPRQFRNNWVGDRLRSLDTDAQANWQNDDGTTYNGGQGRFRGYAFLTLHTNGTPEQKRTLMLRMIQQGLDRLGEQDRGFWGGRGEGQFHGYLFQCYLAAFALGSQDLLDRANRIFANVSGQFGFIKSQAIGYAPGWPHNAGSGDALRWNGWVEPEFEGLPWLSSNGRPSSPDISFAPTITQRYLGVASGTNLLELMAICLLQNGPGGISGYEAFLQSTWSSGAKNETNDQYAAVWFMDLYPLWRHMKESNQIQNWSVNFMQTYRHLIDQPRPLQLPPLRFETVTNSINGYLSATADGFSYNIGSTKWAIPERPVTRQDIRYSQDGGVQFVEHMDVSEQGNFSGLTKSEHLVQVRNWNVNGHMGWSDNYRYTDLDWAQYQGNRMAVTPSGDPAAAAPAQIHKPKLMGVRMPATAQPDYGHIDDPFPFNYTMLAIGGGYFSGHPAPQRQFRKLRNGVPTGDGSWSNSPRFEIVEDDKGQKISGEVRVWNDYGEVIAVTDEVDIPHAPPLPEGTVFESGFGPEFPLFYPEVVSSTAVSNANLEHNPYMPIPLVAVVNEETGETVGSLHGRYMAGKTGGRPRIRVNFAARKPLEPGKKYHLEMHLPVGLSSGYSGNNGNLSGPLRISVGKTVGGDQYDSTSVSATPHNRLHIYSKVIEVPAEETNVGLWVQLLIDTGTGGVSGGSPQWSMVRLTEIMTH